MPQDASQAEFIQVHQADQASVRAELLAGLVASPASVSPKFFYDALGSRLFDAITELAEYYPTRTEAAIVLEQGAHIERAVGRGSVLIDLGAGSCVKAARLFPALQPSAYVAVDISVDYLRDSLQVLQQRHRGLPMLGLGLDFSSQLVLPPAAQRWLGTHGAAQAPRTVLYPGSSIGNFSPADALALLRQAHTLCAEGGAGGGLLIGVDRVKPKHILEPAYADALGVTAAFNRNLLLHVNRVLGTNFNPAQWAHVALFDAVQSRIEMHLAANAAHTVHWPGGERAFAENERVHTENSYKWAPEAFEALLRDAGFGAPVHWTDARAWFSVFWAPASV